MNLQKKLVRNFIESIIKKEEINLNDYCSIISNEINITKDEDIDFLKDLLFKNHGSIVEKIKNDQDSLDYLLNSYFITIINILNQLKECIVIKC